jgi:predicted small lipoprotein YifL
MATRVGIITAFVSRIRTMPQSLAAVALAGLLHLLGGCGQTGPLYLPEEAPAETEQPAAAATPVEGSP